MEITDLPYSIIDEDPGRKFECLYDSNGNFIVAHCKIDINKMFSNKKLLELDKRIEKDY